jgi:hypothetical protein
MLFLSSSVPELDADPDSNFICQKQAKPCNRSCGGHEGLCYTVLCEVGGCLRCSFSFILVILFLGTSTLQ